MPNPTGADSLRGNLVTGATAFIAAIGLVWTLGGAALAPIDQRLDKIEVDSKDMRTTLTPLLTLYAQHQADEDRFTNFQIQIDGKLDKNVFDMSRNSIIDRIAALVVTDNKAMDETLHQVHDLESKIVSREENVVHWNATDALTLRVNALAERCK